MKIVHISAECYPAAKAGGLGDVVGALPKYLNQLDIQTSVIIPKYGTKWIEKQHFKVVYLGTIELQGEQLPFAVERLEDGYTLDFPFYVLNIPTKFDRAGIYADDSGYSYPDDEERFVAFQIAALTWINSWKEKPDVLHCHDHHTGLIPFMVKHCPLFKKLANIPTVYTIHNGVYHGGFSWRKQDLLPAIEPEAIGLLDWSGQINPLACGIKTCWKLTTVSPTYMEELCKSAVGLETLLVRERSKSVGILNGIDNEVWDPATDTMIAQSLVDGDIESYKKANKEALLKRFNVQADLPIITFIGRLAAEKGADLIPDMVAYFLHSGVKANFIVLGSGDPYVGARLMSMVDRFKGFFDTTIEYNETLSHQLYAGSDFLLMPSRVEPCGLNQMYAFRYGTIPIVRSVGGLKDTVVDITESPTEGRGIRFEHFNIEDSITALYRAVELYKQPETFATVRKRVMELDLSWERSAKDYADLYHELVNLTEIVEEN